MVKHSYNEIRETCTLVTCGYRSAGKSQLFVEQYLDAEYNRNYYALFSAVPNSLLPITITYNDLS